MQKKLLLLITLTSFMQASEEAPQPTSQHLETPYAPGTPPNEPSPASQHYTQEELDAFFVEHLGGRPATWGRSPWTQIALERAKAAQHQEAEAENPGAPTVGDDTETGIQQQLNQMNQEWDQMDLHAFPPTPKRSLKVEISKSSQSAQEQKESAANEESFSGLNLPHSMFNASSNKSSRIDSENEEKAREFAEDEIESSADEEAGDNDDDIAQSINTQPDLEVPDTTPELEAQPQWQMPPSLDTSKNPTPLASEHGDSDSDDGVSDYQAAIKATFGTAQQSANAAAASRAQDFDDYDDAGSPSNFKAAIEAVTGAAKKEERKPDIETLLKKQFTDRGRRMPGAKERAEERKKNKKAAAEEPDFDGLNGMFSGPDVDEDEKKTPQNPTSSSRNPLLYGLLAASAAGASMVGADWLGYDVGIDFAEMYVSARSKLKRLIS